MASFRMDSLATATLALIVAMIAVSTKLIEGKPFPAPDLRLCSYPPNSTEGCCTLPYAGNAPLRQFDFQPSLPVRVRPAAHLVDDAYIAKYQKAMELMRALPESDGRSFVAQHRLHCAYCNNHLHFEGNEYPLEIHQTWFFFVWHRLYLYFHERILATLLEDDTFALPYWNWDNQNTTLPLPNEIPRLYASNVSVVSNGTSSLYDPDRNLCSQPPRLVDFQHPTGPCTPEDPKAVRERNEHMLWTQLVSAGVTPLSIHGAPYRFGDKGGVGMGTMEARPHGPVHLWTNVVDMGDNKNSASDPIFFAHHANVDRLWELTKNLPGKYRTDILDPDYLNTAFTFYDENGDQVSATVAQALDHDLLRYKYQEMPAPWTTPDPNWKFCNPNATEADVEALIASTPAFNGSLYVKIDALTFKLKRTPGKSERHGEEMLEFKAKFDWRGIHLQNIFAFLPNSTYEETSIGCPEFLGNLFAFPHTGQSPDIVPELTFRIGIRRKLEAMGRAHLREIVVTLVGEPPIPPYITGEAGFELTSAKIVYSKK